jgi:hypothetical protein
VPKLPATPPRLNSLRTNSPRKQQNETYQPHLLKQPNTKIIVPSEPFYGGKTRLGSFILPHAPIKEGRKLIDLCAGRGNLLWQALKLDFKFKQWILNDPIQLPFFEAVRAIGDQIKVPPRSREEFERQRELAKQGDQRAIALAPWLCYNGGNYGCGVSEFNNGHRSAGGRRTPESEERNLRLMHNFLNDKKMRLSGLDWRDCVEVEHPGPEDLILIDWPYVDCETGAYDPENVLPIEGIDYLKSHPSFHWLFCEYREPMYEYAFGPPIFSKEMQLRSTNFKTAKQKRRVECVWTSDSYKAHIAETGPTVPQVLHATLRDPKEYPNLTKEELLLEIKAVADKIEGYRLRVTAEERERLLPLLIILRRLTKGKKPGYHESLDSIGLNASTVRSWFYRGYHTDEIIAMLEPEAEEVTSTVRRTSDSTRPESVEPGSSEDKTRPIWMDQGIKVRYDTKHRRMEAEANYVEREKKVGKVGDPHEDRVISRITVWQAVYVETKGKVDKSALTKAVLTKLVAAAKDTDYIDNVAITREVNELLHAVKA